MMNLDHQLAVLAIIEREYEIVEARMKAAGFYTDQNATKFRIYENVCDQLVDDSAAGFIGGFLALKAIELGIGDE